VTKIRPIDFVQSWAIYMKKSNHIYGEGKDGGASHFWTQKMHVEELFCVAQSQCYGKGRKKLI
jgi:hypothetical protein